MLQPFRQLKKVEKIAAAFLGLVILFSGFRIVQAFYREYSDILPKDGGVYTEGLVGKLGPLNPLLAQPGSLTADITPLLFSGLTKYDPKTRNVVPDLADFKVSPNGKEYAFVIKEGAQWHDGTPVTGNDVVFTYETVLKNPAFKGAILSSNDYRGMKVVKIDARTVKFLLEKPNSFFLVKTMTGILPEHLLADTPPELLSESSFNDTPIGSGPYRLTSALPVGDHLEVSLEVFPDYYGALPHIQNLLFEIFPEEATLKKHLDDLDGIPHVSDTLAGPVLKETNLILDHYHLPQYVAVFLNNESPILKNKKVRLALQLGTDKASLIRAINETEIIDTPMLEIDQENWALQYSLTKANGALFDTEWKRPDKKTASAAAKTDKPAEAPTTINGPNGGQDFKTTENKVTLTGTAAPKTKSLMVNDYTLKKFVPGDKAWSYVASTDYGNFQKGDNLFELYAIDYAEKKTLLDKITVTYNDATALKQMEKNKIAQENQDFTPLPTRVNAKSETLTLRFITTQTPSTYQQVAELLKEQWKRIGVGVEIDVLDTATFQERVKNRDYDLLLFGQNLGYNLDAYPYWHSSQTKAGGFNLSQFKNFGVDSLLEAARLELNDGARKKILASIQKIMSQEVPAVFLYSPTYSLALSPKIQNVTLTNLSTASDRFATIGDWYAGGSRRLKDGVTLWTFFGWLVKQF